MHPARTLIHTAVLGGLLISCQTDVMETTPPQTPQRSTVASPTPSTSSPAPEADTPPPFDPEQACQQIVNLDQTSFPAQKLTGSLPRRSAEDPSLTFTALSGHIDEREDGSHFLQLSNDALRPCSPFLEDGGIPNKPTLYVHLPSARQDTLYRFTSAPPPPPTPTPTADGAEPNDPTPETAEARLHAWSYRYTTAEDYPYTVAARADTDPGIVVIERVDKEKKTVAGKLLLCRDEGAAGWVLGAFEVPLCPHTAPPSDEEDADKDAEPAQ